MLDGTFAVVHRFRANGSFLGWWSLSWAGRGRQQGRQPRGFAPTEAVQGSKRCRGEAEVAPVGVVQGATEAAQARTGWEGAH